MKRVAFILVTCILSIQASSRGIYNGYLSKSGQDTNILVLNKPQTTSSNILSIKSLYIPGVLIAYGFTALASNELQSLDHKIKKEVWTDHPHDQFKLDNFIQFAPAAAVYGLNIFGLKGKNNLFDRTAIYALSESILGITIESLKTITKVERPDGSAPNSFPSGHTATAFAAAEFLRQEYKSYSPWYGIAGYAVATYTAYLRIYNNRHWFSDVVEGAGIGIISTRLGYWLYPKIKQIFKHNNQSNTVILPMYQNGSVQLSIIKYF